MSLTLPVPQAAAYLGVSQRTVWRRIREGRLGSVRDGRRVLVSVEPTEGKRRVGEAPAPYGLDPSLAADPQVRAWPFTPEKVAAQRERLRQRRIAAFQRIEQLAAQTRPDPEGWSVVEYLSEWRDPDWTPEGDDDP